MESYFRYISWVDLVSRSSPLWPEAEIIFPRCLKNWQFFLNFILMASWTSKVICNLQDWTQSRTNIMEVISRLIQTRHWEVSTMIVFHPGFHFLFILNRKFSSIISYTIITNKILSFSIHWLGNVDDFIIREVIYERVYFSPPILLAKLWWFWWILFQFFKRNEGIMHQLSA